MNLPSVAIVGMGGIGGFFAAGLDYAGCKISALARGETLAYLQSQGLRFTDAKGTRSVSVKASDSAADLGQHDLVIVSVKGPALASVAPAVQALCHSQSTVLVAMNGVPWWFFAGQSGPCANLALRSVDPDGRIAQAIPAQQVVGCVVHASCKNLGPGQVQHVNGRQLIIGEATSPPSSPRLAQLQALLTQSGFDAVASTHIQKDIWYKLWGNMTMNPVSALTGAAGDKILADPLVRGFCSAVMLEAQAIGNAIGCTITQAPDDRHAVTAKLGAFKTSMLQDVEAGKTLELDALVGAVREIGQHLGIATPNIDALMGLTRLMAQSKGLYPA